MRDHARVRTPSTPSSRSSPKLPLTPFPSPPCHPNGPSNSPTYRTSGVLAPVQSATQTARPTAATAPPSWVHLDENVDAMEMVQAGLIVDAEVEVAKEGLGKVVGVFHVAECVKFSDYQQSVLGRALYRTASMTLDAYGMVVYRVPMSRQNRVRSTRQRKESEVASCWTVLSSKSGLRYLPLTRRPHSTQAADCLSRPGTCAV
jgi:hypothetical protein